MDDTSPLEIETSFLTFTMGDLAAFKKVVIFEPMLLASKTRTACVYISRVGLKMAMFGL